MSAADISSLTLPERPYPGIESFHYLDHPIFSGREQESEKLLRYITIYRGVLLYGASGAGKSSLVNAGFIPRAIAEGFRPERIRLQPRPGQEVIVERIPRTARGTDYLPSIFASPAGTEPRIVLSVPELQTKLESVPEGVYPLLIFDQFEEFVSLFEEAPRGKEDVAGAAEVQQNILRLLVDLTRSPSLRVKLLYVFREDYLAKLGKLFALCPNLPDNYLRLTPLPIEALPAIIRGPFEKFPGHFQPELSPKLAAELEAALAARAESGRLNLSEVQIACLRLWQSKDPEAEFRTKGVRGLLEDYLSDSLNQLPAELRDPAVALLSRMVTESGLRNVISKEDLLGRAHQEEQIPRERLERALEQLEGQTPLVRRERRHDVVSYEIISEFLVPWIAGQKAGRKARTEARAQRRKWMVAAAVLLVLALLGGGSAWYVNKVRTQAAIGSDEVKEARAERDKADSDRKAALEELKQARAERDKAVSGHKAVSEELKRKLEEMGKLQGQSAELSRKVSDLSGEKVKLSQRLREQQELRESLSEQNETLARDLGRHKLLAEQRGTALKNREAEFHSERARLQAALDAARKELAPAAPTVGAVTRNPRDGLEYVGIPPGTFRMGATARDSEADTDEKPPHPVRISRGFWLGQTPVTVGAYKRFAAEAKVKMPEAPFFNPGWQKDDHPIVNVSWTEAQAYCMSVGGGLPTEAEWEYAARGGKEGLKYPWGDTISPENANYTGSKWKGTSPVGTYPANSWGLRDMAGNVWQWVADRYDPKYYSTLSAQGPTPDPPGPPRGAERVVRGGSCYYVARDARVSSRGRLGPGNRDGDIGFRCVREVSP